MKSATMVSKMVLLAITLVVLAFIAIYAAGQSPYNDLKPPAQAKIGIDDASQAKVDTDAVALRLIYPKMRALLPFPTEITQQDIDRALVTIESERKVWANEQDANLRSSAMKWIDYFEGTVRGGLKKRDEWERSLARSAAERKKKDDAISSYLEKRPDLIRR